MMHGATSARREAASRPDLLAEQRNCWKIARASKVAVLVDGQAYFDAFVEAAVRAREAIYVIGWDIQSSARLRPRDMPDGLPAELGPFLDALVRRRPGLRVWLLDWDFSLLFAFEREFLPAVQLGWRTHRRVHFRLDGEHPMGASQHQKVVVVDDAVAFAGGLDLTVSRWDRPAHLADDPDRVGPMGRPYRPFHDVQMAVAGEAAQVLGGLARERWRRATGRRLRAPSRGGDPWPPALVPDLVHVPVAVSRTEPAFEGRPEVREVETLYLDAIAAARRWMYFENQYFTSDRIADAVATRLREPEGPEVVVVLPQVCSGWLEESTMGAARERVLRRLREADRFGRLRACYPVVPGPDGPVAVNVHAKVMIVDDTLLRVASSNLSNRSMGLDTECDLALEARGEARVEAAIARVRDRLLAEHLGSEPPRVATLLGLTGSLTGVVDALAGGPRTLCPFDEPCGGWVQTLPEVPLADMERPVAHAPMLADVGLPPELREPAIRTVVRAGAAVALLALGLAACSWLGVGAWMGATALASRAAPFGAEPWTPLLVVAAFLVGGALMVPVTVLLVATILAFGAWPGAAYALAGSIVSAVAAYAAGRRWLRASLGRLVGPHGQRLARRFAPRSWRAVAAVRALPIAPFTAANLVAGGLRVPFGAYLLGTLAGMAPGILLMGLLAYLLGA